MTRLLIVAVLAVVCVGGVGCGRLPLLRRGAACAECPVVDGTTYGEAVAPGETIVLPEQAPSGAPLPPTVPPSL